MRSFIAGCCLLTTLWGAVPPSRPLVGIGETVDRLRLDLSNQDAELQVVINKLENLETIIESLRTDMTTQSTSQKEQIKGNATQTDLKIGTVESTLKQLKTHASETSDALGQYKKTIADLEKKVQAQEKMIDNLQVAIQSLVDILQARVEGVSGPVYRVQAGDSLEKIAKKYKTTVNKIKELNALVNDKIHVSQILKVPDS